MGNDCTMVDQRVFPGGQMFIELENNKQDYHTLDWVRGVIHVNQMAEFASTGLQLKLIGTERTFVQKVYSNGKATWTRESSGQASVCNMEYMIS